MNPRPDTSVPHRVWIRSRGTHLWSTLYTQQIGFHSISVIETPYSALQFSVYVMLRFDTGFHAGSGPVPGHTLMEHPVHSTHNKLDLIQLLR